MTTIQDQLNTASPADVADRLRQVLIGDILAGLVPVERSRTVSSSATQVHDVAATIISVAITTAAKVIVPSGVTAGAGEVQVTYAAATGIPTLVFGDGVTTAYTVVEQTFPSTLVATLATTL